MRRFNQLMRMTSVFALGLSLCACESLENLFDTKKPLPGERKPVFSDGVPGVPQGVPRELVRGYQPPPETPPPAVVEAPAEKPKPVAQPKPRVRSETKRIAVPTTPPATTITVQPGASAVPPPSSWPAPAASAQSQPAPQPPAQQSTAPPPAWPAPQGSTPPPSQWPSAPSSGTR